jgi:hypothetical protein
MDLQTAQKHLDDWLAADRAISTGQSYSVGGRSLTRADAETILSRITYWQRVVDGLKGYRQPVTASWLH